MKSKTQIQQALINEFGENFNTIDNLIVWLKKHYHPQFFSSMQEFAKTPYFRLKNNTTIDDYTDDYITESENYIIILFDDHRDFENAIPEDNWHDEIVVTYDANTKKMIKYFCSSGFGYTNLAQNDIHTFYK